MNKLRASGLKHLLMACSLWLAAYGYSFAQPISSTELINNAKFYDGKIVVYTGEVIGDMMVRGEYAWINVNDGNNAIGIWIKRELIGDILYTGNYQQKGDLVEIKGKFNRACVEHGGDLDIHAQSIIKISSGSKIPHLVNKKEINLILGLTGIIVVVLLLRNAKLDFYKRKGNKT